MRIDANRLEAKNGMRGIGLGQLIEQRRVAQAWTGIEREQAERPGDKLIAVTLDADGKCITRRRIVGHRQRQDHDAPLAEGR